VKRFFEAQLKDVPFFSRLSKRELATVAQKADEVDVKQGEVVAREGEFGQEFFVIIDGTAEVLRADTPIAELGPGEFFGEMALLDEERRTATVRAISPMRVLVMTRQNFRDIDRSMPQVHAAVVEAISARRAMLQAVAAG
jgi:CRP-like cAMP-binding protein